MNVQDRISRAVTIASLSARCPPTIRDIAWNIQHTVDDGIRRYFDGRISNDRTP